MKFVVDRTLPVTLVAQLRGQIEYGIAFGTIKPGSRMPSVRALANQVDVSQMTISTVYKELKDRGILTARSGSGTYVVDIGASGATLAERVRSVRSLLDNLVATAESFGITHTELRRIILARLDQEGSLGRALKVAFVGNFSEATEDYARQLEPQLVPFLANNRLITLTIDELRLSAEAVQALQSADVTVSLAHRLPEVRTYLPDGANIVALEFLPSEATRKSLAELKPGVRVGLITTYAEFLTSLKQTVLSFAPHITVSHTAVLGTAEVENVLRFSEVVIYTTGAESAIAELSTDLYSVEFRYTPDPRAVHGVLVPVLQALRELAIHD